MYIQILSIDARTRAKYNKYLSHISSLSTQIRLSSIGAQRGAELAYYK